MNLFSEMRGVILRVIEVLQQEGALPEELKLDAVTAEPPRDPAHGDISTNAAMVLAKQAGMKPRDLAEMLAERIRAEESVEAVDIAGPGFINLRLEASVWQRMIRVILEAGLGFGNSSIGGGRKVNVEYVSANPTGPMHIGHARGAVVGDALAGLLIKAGYDVTKEYYINDAGAQVEVLAESAHLRYREALGEEIGAIPEGLYPGEYLIPVGESFAQTYGRKYLDAPKEVWQPVLREFVLDSMMALIKSDLLDMGITHDVFASEKALADAGRVQEAFEVLHSKELIYQGVLPPPKGGGGKVPDDWEPTELTLFKSSQFGDDSDRPLKKRNGEWAYIMPDIAYHWDKLQRGFDLMVLELGQDHIGYQKRLKSAVAAFSDRKATLDIVFHSNVKFMENGVPIKMSKRAGTFTTVRDVIDAVGKDVIRFIMLTRKSDIPLDFDLVKVTEHSKDNPVFYVQYAHARCKSVLRHAAQEMPDAYQQSKQPSGALLSDLSDAAELALIKRMAEWPRIVEAAAAAFEPHRVAYYLQELAAEFHGLWNKGNDEAQLRFLQPEKPEATAARLAMLRAVVIVIASGLNVLGVEPVEEMR